MWSVPNVNHVSGTDLPKLACPARFERATYALEEFVAVQKVIYFNNLQHKTGTVQQTVQWFCRVNRHSQAPFRGRLD